MTAGSELELQCAATGDPAPLITWFKDGRQVDHFYMGSTAEIRPVKLFGGLWSIVNLTVDKI